MTGLSGPRYHWRSPFYDNTSKRSFLCWCDNWRQHWAEIHFYGLKCGLFGIVLHLTGRAGMHVVVPNSTEQDCVVLDSVAISCSGQDWTGRDWAELSRIALLNTALDWTRLYCYWLIWTWATMDLNVLGWKGMDWNWTGTNSIGLDWTGLDGRRFHGMDWTARQWSGPDWTEPDSASEDWTGRHALHWTRLSYSELDFIRLHYTALPWIELESTIQDSHCTSLDWSTPNCIWRIQMKLIKNVLRCKWIYSTGLDHTGLLSTAMEVS